MEIDPLLVSAFWPPTTLTGLVVWISIVVLGIAYAYRKKSGFKEGARLQIHWVDFGTRTFATAVSTSLLLLQASGVQLFSPLGGAGTGQLYIAFGLIVSLAILVSNLRQKLDSFVSPITDTDLKSEQVIPEGIDSKFVLSNMQLVILEAAQGSVSVATSTNEIAKTTGLDNATVYRECVILRDTGYIDFTDDSHGTAMLRIIGDGLLALRERDRLTS